MGVAVAQTGTVTRRRTAAEQASAADLLVVAMAHMAAAAGVGLPGLYH